ncbi:octopamine receptor beta-3R-like [Dendronephthya gigantea]|uniref:octopamine receptor beta-3R-like n=1 Tax=Dendronephthya gigantea TaxID=151771 RepID=UPI00106CA8BE|nr:octopamine receptor beta-3R-like [Dendronephthya gigantea]
MQNLSCNINHTNNSCPGNAGAMPPNQSQTYVITSTVLLSVLIPAIIIGNGLVILAFGTTRRLRTTTNYFVVSLAFADIMVGLLSLPIFTVVIYKNTQWFIDNPDMNNLWKAVDMITSIASITNLMYISIDRYVCIQYPLRYYGMVTRKKVIVMIIVSWMYGALNFTLIQATYRRRMPRLDVNLAVTILAFIIPLLVILVMYGKVGKIALNHRVRIMAIDQEQRAAQGYQNSSPNDQESSRENGQDTDKDGRRTSHKNKRIISLLAELKATRTLAVVVGAFVLCFIGYFVILLHTTICLSWRSLKCKPARTEVVVAMQWIKYFNSSLNPLIYSVMNGEMRRAMKRLGRTARLSQTESTLEMN